MDNHFVITTPVYNSEQWIQRCVESVINQNYNNWEMVIINDCSSDNTDAIIKKFINNPRITYICNPQNEGALYNIDMAIIRASKSPRDVIVNLDGDDCFANNNVLTYINNVYQDLNVWLSYGDYKSETGEPSQNNEILDTKKYRKNQVWCSSHLRTFKRHLYDRIKKEDLKDENNQFFRIAPDLALMYPMIEMAGKKRIKFVKEILYVYNDMNPLNEFKKDPQGLGYMRNQITGKTEYAEIK